jgi:uncharacterized protein (DUF1330 family)
MSAYVVIDVDVRDAGRYEEYKRLAPASVAAYGGKYVARGGRCLVLEGDWTPSRLVILEFPSLESARRWMDSPEYAPARIVRRSCSKANLVVIEGLEGD